MLQNNKKQRKTYPRLSTSFWWSRRSHPQVLKIKIFFHRWWNRKFSQMQKFESPWKYDASLENLTTADLQNVIFGQIQNKFWVAFKIWLKFWNFWPLQTCKTRNLAKCRNMSCIENFWLQFEIFNHRQTSKTFQSDSNFCIWPNFAASRYSKISNLN